MSSPEPMMRWKGKFIKKKKYDQLMTLINVNKRRAEERAEVKVEEKKNQEIKELEDFENDDERIVSLKILGRQLWCTSCKEALTLENIESERRRGFGSSLLIKCHKCLLNNEIVTGRQSRKNLFDRNYLAVKGAVESGIKWSQLYKFCSIMKLPCPERTTFKKYEKTIVTDRINTEVNPLEVEHKLLLAQLAQSQSQIAVESSDNPAKKVVLGNENTPEEDDEEDEEEEVTVYRKTNAQNETEKIQENDKIFDKENNN
ncbi:hypothetical protein HCN44_005564 [Aphidius gifuensis]|uniref:Mutator-like transposase domain-containing protein n=1 Tax=Aphidius gifuensis TaxID=684658 RepID=A0A834Y3W0_APHGI|nr:uncharacterized protein LOC122847673 [Aphidius gifuensis]KAF7997287.1 hypothetical protein HCN44_005564 [Aphidius gifuensis]